MAIVAAPVMAITQDVSAMGGNGVDILGNGIIESGDNAFKFPFANDTNFDSITVGNDIARAYGWGDPAKAENNLEVKKNQQVGPADCCQALNNSCPCQECSPDVNIDQVHAGDRTAQAFGEASAVNNVKLVLNQAR